MHFLSSYPRFKVINSLISSFSSLLVGLDELESDKKNQSMPGASCMGFPFTLQKTMWPWRECQLAAKNASPGDSEDGGQREGRSSEMNWNVKGCKTLTGVGGGVRIRKEDREDGLNWSGENKCQEDGGNLGGRQMEDTGELSWKQQTWRNGKTDRCRCDGREWGGWRKKKWLLDLKLVMKKEEGRKKGNVVI